MSSCKKTVAAYYFPNYHQDKRNLLVHGPGWDEWELMRNARPRFERHIQPKVPLWGYEDEADPEVMAKKIRCAGEYGVDVFIFDWYYYEDGLFLERALEEGFMPSAGENTVKFALMWANHDWMDIHPWRAGDPRTILYCGELSDAAFERMTDYIIGHYFRHPAYWKIDGEPYFSIYSSSLLGSPERLKRFREKTVAAGFPGLHINLILQNIAVLPGESGFTGAEDDSGAWDAVSSYGSYIWLHHCRLDTFPRSAYKPIMQEYFEKYRALAARSGVPCSPNVTVAWDSSPRTVQDTPYTAGGKYPYTPVMESTPEMFADALDIALNLDSPVVTINAWNEWTEGSYLEPDTLHGYGYLEALKQARIRNRK